jgi:hypothetical protein
MFQPAIQPQGDLTQHLAAFQNALRRLRPARGSGTITRFSTSGVSRTALPGRTVRTSSTGGTFY